MPPSPPKHKAALKKIRVEELTVGMYLHKIEAPWLDHPFWRKSFLIKTAEEIARIKSSNATYVIINIEKGADALPSVEIVLDRSRLESTPDQGDTRNKSNSIWISGGKREKAADKQNAASEAERASRIIESATAAVAQMFSQVRLGKALQPESAIPIVDEMTASIVRHGNVLTSLVRLKSKDDYTYMHSVAVCALMIALAKELGMDEIDVKRAGLAGLLHDIGKMAIDDRILDKPGALTDTEFDIVKQHPRKGHAILAQIEGLDAMALDVCLHHHEKIDGSGYPEGLSDTQISIFAKMGAVCDVYDAVTSERPYKSGWEPATALRKMSEWKQHFDPAIFKAFVKSVGIYPIGSLLKLKSGRLAVVIEQNEKSLLLPVIKVFYSTKSQTRVMPEVIDLAKQSYEEIVSVEDPAVWGISDINKLWTSHMQRRMQGQTST